jgi:hypothetical protein
VDLLTVVTEVYRRGMFVMIVMLVFVGVGLSQSVTVSCAKPIWRSRIIQPQPLFLGLDLTTIHTH